MCLILSTRSDEQVHRDLVIRNNHMRVLHVYLAEELLGWDDTCQGSTVGRPRRQCRLDFAFLVTRQLE